jgi:NAD(P)-dependent dehydrogenase (short-subunit alcohol dehydrogenase family)
MTDRVVLITGASGGLGPHVVRAFLESGATVAGSSRRISDGDFAHPRFAAFSADLTGAQAAGSLASRVVERFGRIDVLAHVAGGFAGGRPIHETDDATWEAMMNLNLRAAFYIFRAVIPQMRRAGRGRIIAIASRAAAEPAANAGAYGASKAALVSLVKTAAIENRGTGIAVNAVLPGTIDTEANRAGDPVADRSGWISPERLAALVLFLAGDEAAEITGAAIPVYGSQI